MVEKLYTQVIEKGDSKAFEVLRDTKRRKANRKTRDIWRTKTRYKYPGDGMTLDLKITKKQQSFIDAKADEILFGGAARWSASLMAS